MMTGLGKMGRLSQIKMVILQQVYMKILKQAIQEGQVFSSLQSVDLVLNGKHALKRIGHPIESNVYAAEKSARIQRQ